MTLAPFISGMRAGRPTTGPLQVHIDITNGCNAACVTCWDHSPLLTTPRSSEWKRRRMSLDSFAEIVDQLEAMASVNAVVVSGMGDPLTHPQVYVMLELVKRRGWHLTVLSNLVAADPERLAAAGVDNLLVGVQGVSSDSYTAFHPGWTEQHFNRMCHYLRVLTRAGVSTRHVQVINRDNADEVVEMVRFGKLFRAERVNFKLASLAEGTESCRASSEQLTWLAEEGIPKARSLAEQLGVRTNLELFEKQVAAARRAEEATVPIAETGCWMGFVYTRITVDREVLYCCNTNVSVGSLKEASFEALWWGERWHRLRETLSTGRFFKGCDRCGKYEQNAKWAARLA